MFTPQISSYEELIKKRTSVSGSVKEVERFST
jgi:hypothetical protein